MFIVRTTFFSNFLFYSLSLSLLCFQPISGQIDGFVTLDWSYLLGQTSLISSQSQVDCINSCLVASCTGFMFESSTLNCFILTGPVDIVQAGPDYTAYLRQSLLPVLPLCQQSTVAMNENDVIISSGTLQTADFLTRWSNMTVFSTIQHNLNTFMRVSALQVYTSHTPFNFSFCWSQFGTQCNTYCIFISVDLSEGLMLCSGVPLTEWRYYTNWPDACRGSTETSSPEMICGNMRCYNVHIDSTIPSPQDYTYDNYLCVPLYQTAHYTFTSEVIQNAQYIASHPSGTCVTIGDIYKPDSIYYWSYLSFCYVPTAYGAYVLADLKTPNGVITYPVGYNSPTLIGSSPFVISISIRIMDPSITTLMYSFSGCQRPFSTYISQRSTGLCLYDKQLSLLTAIPQCISTSIPVRLIEYHLSSQAAYLDMQVTDHVQVVGGGGVNSTLACFSHNDLSDTDCLHICKFPNDNRCDGSIEYCTYAKGFCSSERVCTCAFVGYTVYRTIRGDLIKSSSFVYLGSNNSTYTNFMSFPAFKTLFQTRRKTLTVQTLIADVPSPTPSVTPTYGISVSVKDYVLTIAQRLSNPLTISLSKDGQQRMFLTPQTFYQISIPDTFYSTSGQLHVQVYVSEVSLVLAFDGSFELIGVQSCPVYQCTFCHQSIDNYYCLPKSGQAIVGLLITALALLILYLTFILIRMFIGCCVILSFMTDIEWCCCVNKARKMRTRMYERFQLAREKAASRNTRAISTDVEVGDGVPSMRKNSRSRLLRTAALASMITPSESCAIGSFIPVDITQCIIVGAGRSNCSAEFDLSFTVPYPGAEACITIGDRSSSATVGTIHVLYESVSKVVSLSKQYYTSDFDALEQSFHDCGNVGWCDGNGCSVAPDQNVDDYFSPEIMKYPGVTGCHTSGGGASNGCPWSYSDSCTYSRWAIKPKAPYFEVMTPTSISVSPRINITYIRQDGASTVLFYGDVVAGQVYALSNGGISTKFQLQGTFADPVSTIFGDSQVVWPLDPSQGAHYGIVSPLNSPVCSLVGDIQADQANDLVDVVLTSLQAVQFDSLHSTVVVQENVLPQLLSTSLAAFTSVVPSLRYNPNCFKWNTGKYDSLVYQRSGVSTQLNSLQQFPLFIGPDRYDFYHFDQVMKTTSLSGGALSASIATTSPVLFSRSTSLVCPVASFKYAEGCYSCDQGSRIRITARSTCMAGSVLLSVDDESIILSTNSVGLDVFDQDYYIAFHTGFVNNRWNLFLSSDSRSAQLSVSFIAGPSSTVIGNNYTTGVVISVPSSSDGFGNFGRDILDAFSNPFSSLADSLGSFLASILVFCLYIGVILITYKAAVSLVGKFCKSKDPKRRNSGKDRVD